MILSLIQQLLIVLLTQAKINEPAVYHVYTEKSCPRYKVPRPEVHFVLLDKILISSTKIQPVTPRDEFYTKNTYSMQHQIIIIFTKFVILFPIHELWQLKGRTI